MISINFKFPDIGCCFQDLADSMEFIFAIIHSYKNSTFCTLIFTNQKDYYLHQICTLQLVIQLRITIQIQHEQKSTHLLARKPLNITINYLVTLSVNYHRNPQQGTL